MRAAFGKVNSLHNHVLPWADRPLVINNLVGGEDGIDDAGVSVAHLIPNPWIFLEATGQVFRGDSGPEEQPLYQTSQRGQLSYVAPPARLPGHHRVHATSISGSRTHAATTASGICAEHRRPDDESGRLRRDRAVEAAAAIDLPLVRRPLRGDLEPPRAAERPAERHGLLRLGRLPARAALVRGRALRRIRSGRRRDAARHAAARRS